MEVDLIIARKALEKIATPYRQMVLNFEVQTITAPAPDTSPEQDQADTVRWWRDGVSAHLIMEHLVEVLRKRSSSIQMAVRKAPKQPWNGPYSVGGRGQPGWSGNEHPFSKDIFELGSNNDWVMRDFETRRAQIEDWAAAKEARETALQTTVPDANFCPVEGLCDTYTADQNSDWYEMNLSGNVLSDYTAALRVVNAETITYHQALKTYKFLTSQDNQHPVMVE